MAARGHPRRRLRRFLVVAALFGGLVVGVLLLCRVRATAGLERHSLRFQQHERTFFVRLPPQHEKTRAVPLVIALHGGRGTAAHLNSATRFSLSAEADARGWVLLIPQGIAKGWNDGRPIVDRASRARAGVDDVGFISALIDYAHDSFGIDRDRVFVTGISNGGAMSFRLAVDLSDKLRAIAPVTMSLPANLQTRTPKRPVAVLMVNGTEDSLVPFAGGQVRVLGKDRGEVLSTPATLDWFAKHNGCTGTAAPRTLPDVDPSDGTRVTYEARSGCRTGALVALYRVDGGGHTWPGGRQYLPQSVIGRVSQDTDASRVIFQFFEEQSR